ncbi:MAG: TetR family transcriptional regulator [Caulobacter sp.]|nr:TetR family transcriptional regulator [Caulobacter sp.]
MTDLATRQGRSAAAARPSSRDLLLNSVSQLFAERNALTVTLGEIAAHAGVNAALVKYYFGGKSGLFLALLERDLQPQLDALKLLLTLDIPHDRKMRIHLEGMVRTYFRLPYLNRLTGHVLREQEQDEAEHHQRYVEPMIDAYRVMIAGGVRAGVFKPMDPLLFYISTVGMCDHFVSARQLLAPEVGPDGFDEAFAARYADHVVQIVLRGILT